MGGPGLKSETWATHLLFVRAIFIFLGGPQVHRNSGRDDRGETGASMESGGGSFIQPERCIVDETADWLVAAAIERIRIGHAPIAGREKG